MDNTGIQPVMNVGGGYGDGFGGGWMGIFGLLVLLGILNGGGGFFGGGNNNAIQNDINRGFDNQNTMAQTRDILGAVTGGTAQTIAASTANASNAINAIKDGNASLIREFGNVETALTALSGKQQECCCNILRAIDGVNYNVAQQAQGVKDLLTQNRMEDLQARINQLELREATAGMLRFPNQWAYGAGPFPPIFGGCNQQNI